MTRMIRYLFLHKVRFDSYWNSSLLYFRELQLHSFWPSSKESENNISSTTAQTQGNKITLDNRCSSSRICSFKSFSIAAHLSVSLCSTAALFEAESREPSTWLWQRKERKKWENVILFFLLFFFFSPPTLRYDEPLLPEGHADPWLAAHNSKNFIWKQRNKEKKQQWQPNLFFSLSSLWLSGVQVACLLQSSLVIALSWKSKRKIRKKKKTNHFLFFFNLHVSISAIRFCSRCCDCSSSAVSCCSSSV